MPNHYEGFGEVTNPDGSPWYPEYGPSRPEKRTRETMPPPPRRAGRVFGPQAITQDPWPIEGQDAPRRVDPFEETARIEREMPHIQREVAFRDALNSLPGRAWDAGADALGGFVDRLINVLR